MKIENQGCLCKLLQFQSGIIEEGFIYDIV